MKAAVYYGEKDVRVEDVEDPVPSEGEVLLRPHYCGICGTDLSAWNHGTYGSGVILGHEFSCEVVEESGPWNKGDRIVANSIIPCMKCTYCREGKYSLCDNVRMPGITVNGGLAELVVLPQDSLYVIPDSVTMKEAALVEPLSVVLHGFSLIDFKPGKTVLVVGAGTLGLLSLQIAQMSGASFVAVSEPNSSRRKLAEEMGAYTIDPSGVNVSLEFENAAGGPADLVIECAGKAPAASETFTLARKGGTVLVLGLSEEPVDADFMTAVLNELKFQFSYCGYSEFPTALRLLEKGMVCVQKIITKEINLRDVVEKGFKELTKPGSDVKILVKVVA